MNKKIVILGAGTAGTMVANKIAKQHPAWQVSIVDQHDKHYYQPGFLLYPFGRYEEDDLLRPRQKYLPKNAHYIQSEAKNIEAEQGSVQLVDQSLEYDALIIATGSHLAPEEIPGMKSSQWHKSIYDFYSFEGAKALRNKLAAFHRGKLVVHVTEMPIKCPVAPLEFSFLADDYFKKRGLRDAVSITYVTPLDGAFTQPKASQSLGYLLQEKDISIVADFGTERIDPDKKKIISYDDREVEYDLLVTVPTNKGDAVMERSGLGDELNFVPTNKHTLQSKAHKNIFVIGDATDVPTSKAGSVAHFQVDTLVENVANYFDGKELVEGFDGHANCFVETGGSKGLLLDFNYETQPLEGRFPFPVVGPLALLKESRLNHLGKLAFRWIYWNVLMKGRPMIGIPNKMSLSGKRKE